jgi:hypothetical protein
MPKSDAYFSDVEAGVENDRRQPAETRLTGLDYRIHQTNHFLLPQDPFPRLAKENITFHEPAHHDGIVSSRAKASAVQESKLRALRGKCW